MATRVLSTETGAAQGEIIWGDPNVSVYDLALKVSQRLLEAVRSRGPGLVVVGAPPIENPQVALTKLLANRNLPSVAIDIRETLPKSVLPVPMAPGTEFRMVIKEAGFMVIDADAAKPGERGVDFVISVDGASSDADPIGDLVCATAHIKLIIKDRSTGQVCFASQIQAFAAASDKNTAAQTAMHKAEHALALEVLEYFEKTKG